MYNKNVTKTIARLFSDCRFCWLAAAAWTLLLLLALLLWLALLRFALALLRLAFGRFSFGTRRWVLIALAFRIPVLQKSCFGHQFVILGSWSKRSLNCSPGFPYEIMVVVAVVCFAVILIIIIIVVIFDAVVTKSLLWLDDLLKVFFFFFYVSHWLK